MARSKCIPKGARSSGETADDVIALRIVADTRQQYDSIILRIVRWLEVEHPEYIAQGAMILPVSVSACKLMLSFASVKRDKDGRELVPRKHNAVTTVNRLKSALLFVHKEAGVEVIPETYNILKDFVSGYKRKYAQLKDSGEVPVAVGKAPLSVSGYQFLATTALAATSDHALHISAHSFLLLCWNLMARAVSASSIRYEHVSWKNDALEIQYAVMKNDQEGQMSFPRHVYANPVCPEICPVLSLAVLVFTRGANLPGSPSLLFGYNSKERFSSWLQNTCASREDDIVSMGLAISEIGTHSFRKGVASSLSNCPGGPQAVSIWLRAGWSLGSVQGQYIFEGSGGDQFVGRAATGLNVNDAKFATLPPHFGNTALVTPSQWEEILPGYSTFYPPSFRSAIPFLLASLVHHRDWLHRTLHSSHPLFLSPVWASGLLIKLLPNVYLGTLHNPATNLVATGIPPHVPLYQQLQAMQQSLSSVTTALENGFSKIPEQIRSGIDSGVPENVPVAMSLLQETLHDFGVALLSKLTPSPPLHPTQSPWRLSIAIQSIALRRHRQQWIQRLFLRRLPYYRGGTNMRVPLMPYLARRGRCTTFGTSIGSATWTKTCLHSGNCVPNNSHPDEIKPILPKSKK
ncbi:Aste57867_13060 [Aphanomyces stellatus]|uniref:Aste57867_13060 protein n=1 Tax=Aphanomyces stellatus TaxID=120398 RepID=A0A485KXM6_9STRA|nr:hypothetical protein As57867_013012 [Aphanomyces stellatus]VFT89905.1 Aste57867_13060 [Aphanomyces stellatus]